MGRIKKKAILILAAAAVVFGAGAAMGRENLLCAEAAQRPVSITSCLISETDVVCELEASSIPTNDDDMFYIFADEVYEDGTDGRVVATVDAEKSVSVSFPLDYDSEDSNLSRKFLVAVKRGGKMYQVSDEHYITNPEAIAKYSSPRMEVGIKGLLPDVEKLQNGDLEELGIQQVVYNMSVDEICSDESVSDAISFNYNGKNYYFDNTVISNYDAFIKAMNAQGIQLTIVLLNDGSGLYSQDLVHPMAKNADNGEIEEEARGYALNVAEEAGTSHLKAIGAFLGWRYSGQLDCGQVDNWILGNEVNARTSWWYSSSNSLDFNVGAYVKAFRIIYNEIKSMNANAMVYNSIDQEWNRKSNPGSFLARDYLDLFNYYMIREGNIDWGLSYHPYNSPLYDPYAWNGPAVWVKDNLSTPYITMQNIDLLIEYMKRDQFLNPAGEVRSISLAEIGYTSSFGDEKQEASVAYGYLKAASIPEIDSFVLFRQTDDAHEMKSHLALGLYGLDGNRKPAFDIYKNLGPENEQEAKDRASEIIGMDIDEMINENIVWTRSGDGVVK